MACSSRSQRRSALNGPLLIPSAITEKLKTVARASAPRMQYRSSSGLSVFAAHLLINKDILVSEKLLGGDVQSGNGLLLPEHMQLRHDPFSDLEQSASMDLSEVSEDEWTGFQAATPVSCGWAPALLLNNGSFACATPSSSAAPSSSSSPGCSTGGSSINYNRNTDASPTTASQSTASPSVGTSSRAHGSPPPHLHLHLPGEDAPSSPSAPWAAAAGEAYTPAASVPYSPRTAAAVKHLSRTRFGARMVQVRDTAIAAAAMVRAEAAAAAAFEAEVAKLMSRGATRPQAETLARRRLAPPRLGNGRSLKRLPSQARDIEGDRIQEGVCGDALRAEEGRVTLQVQLSGRPCSC